MHLEAQLEDEVAVLHSSPLGKGASAGGNLIKAGFVWIELIKAQSVMLTPVMTHTTGWQVADDDAQLSVKLRLSFLHSTIKCTSNNLIDMTENVTIWELL